MHYCCKGVFLRRKSSITFDLKKRTLYFLLFAIFLYSCKSNRVVKGAAPSHFKNDIDQKNFDAAFYEGSKQMVLGNHNEAIVLFKKCLDLDPKSDAATYLLAKEFNLKRSFAISASYARIALKLNSENVWYHLLLADDLKHTDQTIEAASIFEHIATKFKGYETYFFDASESYVIIRKYNDALRCLNKIEKLMGVNEDISFKKVDLFLKLSKKELAIAEFQKLITTFPNRIRYNVALAEVYFGFNEAIKGDAILKEILTKDPEMPEAHLLLANRYRFNGKDSLFFSELKIVFRNPDANIKQKLEVISSFLPTLGQNLSELNEVLELGAILSKTHPDDDACKMVYADILFHGEKYEDAKICYLKVIIRNKSNFSLWQNLLECEDQLKQYSEAISYADQALEAFPNQAIFYYYKAYFCFRIKDYHAAAETAKNGYDIGSDRAQLLLQLLSIAGDSYNVLKNYSASDEAYEKILELDPNNLQTLNNYSYYLSLRKQYLDKAAKMSKKTLEIDPDNASYADTYGWILFQQANYVDAKTYIEKALTMQPENGVLSEHLGDVCYRLNDKEKALFYWKLAKKNGNKSELLQQKINTGTLNE